MTNIEGTRIKNSKRNISSGIISSLAIFVINFSVRTAILYIFNERYLGLNSVFTSLISILNVSELGLSNAIIVSLYKPLADGDETSICALLSFYRQIYRGIGIAITLIGIMIVPILPSLMKDNQIDGINIYIIYGIYLLDAVISYFMYSYKTVLLTASQRFDITKKIYLIANLLKAAVQIFSIIILNDFYLYTLALFFATVLNNIIVNVTTKRIFPEYKCKGRISRYQIRKIGKQIKGLAIGKLSHIARNAFDNLILSAFFGLAEVAVYGNYYILYNNVLTVLWTITGAVQASVANSIVTESIEKNYQDLLKFEFIFGWLITWFTSCFLCLYQPFMRIWAGEELMLSEFDMLLFCIYFYMMSINSVRNLYYDGTGLWWEGRFISLIEAIGNFILNIILGKIFGITGILFATIITILIFNYIGITNIVFKNYFKKSTNEFYANRIFYTIVTIGLCSISYYLTNRLFDFGILDLFLRLIFCSIIMNIGMLILYCRNRQFIESVKFIRKIISVHW